MTSISKRSELPMPCTRELDYQQKSMRLFCDAEVVVPFRMAKQVEAFGFPVNVDFKHTVPSATRYELEADN